MTEIHVQVVPKGSGGGDLTRRRLIEDLKDRVAELGDSIMDVATGLQDQLRRTDNAPHESPWRLTEAEVSFSIDLEAEAGVIVSRASAGASFEVSLKWSRE